MYVNINILIMVLSHNTMATPTLLWQRASYVHIQNEIQLQLHYKPICALIILRLLKFNFP